MNAPVMNKVQLCCAGSGVLEVAAKPVRDPRPAARRAGIGQVAARRAAALVLVATVLAVGAAVWLVVSRTAPPLPIVELPRVVITAERLPPGICPVPVEPADADCPVPLQASPAEAAAPIFLESSPSRSTP